jgi:hypothetical protein
MQRGLWAPTAGNNTIAILRSHWRLRFVRVPIRTLWQTAHDHHGGFAFASRAAALGFCQQRRLARGGLVPDASDGPRRLGRHPGPFERTVSRRGAWHISGICLSARQLLNMFDARGVAAMQQPSNFRLWISIQFHFDEFAAAMAVLDQGMDLAGDKIDAGQQADRAVRLYSNSRATVACTPGSGGRSGAVVAMAWMPG